MSNTVKVKNRNEKVFFTTQDLDTKDFGSTLDNKKKSVAMTQTVEEFESLSNNMKKQKSQGNFVQRPFNSTQRMSYSALKSNPSSNLHISKPKLLKKDRTGGLSGQEEFEIEKKRNAQRKS